MRAFVVRVHATPGEKLVFEGNRPKGYYQSIGVTAQDDAELLRCVRHYVLEDTGGSVLEIDDVEVADLEGTHREIKDVSRDPATPGVWYASGRAFYEDDDD